MKRSSTDVAPALIFGPAVRKAWAGLVRSTHPVGKLGWAQPIGASPTSVSFEQTDVYDTGAFLPAGTEVRKLVSKH